MMVNNFSLGISLAALPRTLDVRLMNLYTVLRVDRTVFVLSEQSSLPIVVQFGIIKLEYGMYCSQLPTPNSTV
jgi:hypothetical protein